MENTANKLLEEVREMISPEVTIVCSKVINDHAIVVTLDYGRGVRQDVIYDAKYGTLMGHSL